MATTRADHPLDDHQLLLRELLPRSALRKASRTRCLARSVSVILLVELLIMRHLLIEKFFHRRPNFFTCTLHNDRRLPGYENGPRSRRSPEAGGRGRVGTLRTRRCHRRSRRSCDGGGPRRARSATRHRGRDDARSRARPRDPGCDTPSPAQPRDTERGSPPGSGAAPP